jgi:hypothetical protein
MLPKLAQHLVEAVMAVHAGHSFDVDDKELVEWGAVKVLHSRRSKSKLESSNILAGLRRAMLVNSKYCWKRN